MCVCVAPCSSVAEDLSLYTQANCFILSRETLAVHTSTDEKDADTRSTTAGAGRLTSVTQPKDLLLNNNKVKERSLLHTVNLIPFFPRFGSSGNLEFA